MTTEQTAGTDLHTRIREALQKRLAVAQRAEEEHPGPWRYGMVHPHRDAIVDRDGREVMLFQHHYEPTSMAVDQLLANDPASTIRRAERDLRALDRHALGWASGEPEYSTHMERTESGQLVEVRNAEPDPPYYCNACSAFAPCVEVRELAAGEGLEP